MRPIEGDYKERKEGKTKIKKKNHISELQLCFTCESSISAEVWGFFMLLIRRGDTSADEDVGVGSFSLIRRPFLHRV